MGAFTITWEKWVSFPSIVKERIRLYADEGKIENGSVTFTIPIYRIPEIEDLIKRLPA